MIRNKKTLAAAFLLSLSSLASSFELYAHHGLAQFDSSTVVEIEGVVVDFKLMDPHSLLYVEVKQDSSHVSTWRIEGGSAHGIVKSGLTSEFLRSRPRVHIRAYQSKDGLCNPRCTGVGRQFIFDDLLPKK